MNLYSERMGSVVTGEASWSLRKKMDWRSAANRQYVLNTSDIANAEPQNSIERFFGESSLISLIKAPVFPAGSVNSSKVCFING